MSGPERPPDDAVPTTKLKRKHFSSADYADLDKLDDVFKRIKKAVTQPPYIISTPSLHPYMHRSRQESQAWMMGRLFKPDEEYLQYRTFLFREPYQDCFTLQPGEDEEPEVRPPKTQLSHVASQVPKKKISLSDYKKQANGVLTPGSKKVSPSLPATKAPPVHVNGVKPAQQPPPPADQKQDEVKSAKRHAPESLPEKPPKRPREEPPAAPTPPRKTESAESKINLDKSGPSSSTPHGLPPLLSPVDEPLSNPHGLPTILSPTLPASIQVELDRLETQRKRGDSNASTSSSDRKSQLLTVPEPRSQRSESASRERSTSLSGKSPHAAAPVQEEAAETGLLVKLKYTKKSRETIKRLLNLPPKKDTPSVKKEREDAARERDESTDRTSLAQKRVPEITSVKPKPIPKIAARRPDSVTGTPTSKPPVATPKTAEKRPRTDDDSTQATSNKRPRALSSLVDGPSTPKDQLSPAPSNKSSAQKSQATHLTPRKDIKAMSMLRTASTESQDPTPGKSGRSDTPDLGSKHLDVKAPTSAPVNSKKQMDISLLQHTSMKLNQKGRSLKHEAQKLEREKGANLSKEDQKRAAVIGLECILSYMAAYHAQDLTSTLRGRPADVEGTWKTLHPLCVSYARLTKDFRHIDGFRSHLGAVIAAQICTLVAPRAPNPKAHDTPHDLSQSDLAKQHSQLSENFGLLSKHYTLLLQHTQDARRLLPMEDIRKDYRRTWAAAADNAELSKGLEKQGTKLSGPFFLPIQNDTKPIHAVRFGLKFLAELCKNEGISHVISVDLDKVH